VLLEALRISRTLGQEYRFAVLELIVNSKCYHLTKLALFEDMERAMLAVQAEKLQVDLCFNITHTVGHMNFKFDIGVNVSW
jgi:hypothetical protein